MWRARIPVPYAAAAAEKREMAPPVMRTRSCQPDVLDGLGSKADRRGHARQLSSRAALALSPGRETHNFYCRLLLSPTCRAKECSATRTMAWLDARSSFRCLAAP